MKLFIATKAFISYKGKILLLRESAKYKDGANAGKFDVVGGRVEPGQHWDESLRREILEETGLLVTIGKPFHVGEWRPIVRGEEWQVIGVYLECTTEDDSVRLSEDHQEHVWIDPTTFRSHPLIENVQGAFEAYLKRT